MAVLAVCAQAQVNITQGFIACFEIGQRANPGANFV